MHEHKIGLIGIGLLGSALAERLLGAGFEVSGYDIDEGRREHFGRLSGTACRDASEVTSSTRRIVLSLPTTDVVESVLHEVKAELRSGQVIVDTTTGDPERTVEELLRVYDERFARAYGPLHPRVRDLMEACLRCGDPHFGFLRLRCCNPDCEAKHELLLPFS